MNINDLRKKTVITTLPEGIHEVEFEKVDYRVDDKDEVLGVFIHVKNYKPLYLKWFENNYEYDNLLEQLGCVSYDDAEINKHAGQMILVIREYNMDYLNSKFAMPKNTSAPF